MAINRIDASVGEAATQIIPVPIRDRPSLGYFYLGSVLLMGFLLQASLGLSWPALEALQATMAYKMGSGALLLVYLGTQWQVPYLRFTRRYTAAGRKIAEHKLIGVLGPLVLYLHASSMGTRYTWLLSLLFIGNATVALLNRETLGIRARWFWLGWLALHITLAVAVTTLGALHIYTALYYE